MNTPRETPNAQPGAPFGEGFAPFVERYGQAIVDVLIFLDLSAWGVWETYRSVKAGAFGYVELAFTAQNVLMLAMILARKPHRAVDRSIPRQLVALVAFYSGLAFLAQSPTGGPVAAHASQAITLVANILGAVTLVNLGRSFGILIALRTVKTTGLYRVVRHPMYGTDILLRIGFVVGHFSAWTLALFVMSTLAYVYRAILEERFLCQDPAYGEYMKRVRWRFLPGVF